jgi:hypothetical protein
MKSIPAPFEVADAELDVGKWRASIVETDKTLASSSVRPNATDTNRAIKKPVRGSASTAAQGSSQAGSSKSGRVSGVEAPLLEPHLQGMSKIQRAKLIHLRTDMDVTGLSDVQRRHKAGLFVTCCFHLNCEWSLHSNY